MSYAARTWLRQHGHDTQIRDKSLKAHTTHMSDRLAQHCSMIGVCVLNIVCEQESMMRNIFPIHV